MEKIFYDIHGLLKLQVIISDRNHPHELFDALEVFRVLQIKNVDITVKIGKKPRKPDDSYVVNHNHYVAPQSLYTRGKYRSLRYQVSYLWSADNKVDIDLEANFSSPFLRLQRYAIIQNFFIQPLIELELLKRGVMTIHAAAVSKDNQGFLMLGRGGVFKTTLAMWLVKSNGFQFLSDDKVLVDVSGKMYSYQTLPRIFSFRLNELETEAISRWQKFKFLSKSNASKQGPEITPRTANFTRMVFMSKTSDSQLPTKITRETALKKLMCNYEMENNSSQGLSGYTSSIFNELMLSHAFIFPNSDISEIRKQYLSNCETVFIEPEFVEIHNGSKIDRGQIQPILQILE